MDMVDNLAGAAYSNVSAEDYRVELEWVCIFEEQWRID